MAVYTVTSANWNSATFWGGIAVSEGGHTLDFSGLPATFSVNFDAINNVLVISDGSSSFTIADSASSSGADAVLGGDGLWEHFDTLILNDGDNTVTAGSGDEWVEAGSGNDTIFYGEGADTVYGGAGNDVIDDTAGYNGTVTAAFIDAGDGDDSVFGTTAADTVFGGAGNDTISGEGGNDALYGGAGADVIDGGDGDDFIDAGFEDDAADTLYGGAGNDILLAAAGDDLVSGGAGGDALDGGRGNDTLFGDEDGDRIVGHTGQDSVEGGAGDDTLTGGGDGDQILGGDGQDHIFGGAGDTIDGGGDWDRLYVRPFDSISDANATSGTITFLGGGTLDFNDIEEIIVLNTDYIVSGTAGDEVIGSLYMDVDGDWIDNDDAPGGGDGDVVMAGAGNDSVFSLDGDDTVYGEAGNDELHGDDGNDLLFGGDGNDTLNTGFGSFNDVLYGGADDDVLNDQGTAESGDVLDGGAGNDTVNGGRGDDLVAGGPGNDSLSGGDGDDVIHGGGTVNVTASEDFSTAPLGWVSVADGQPVTTQGSLNDGNQFLGPLAGNGTGAEQINKTFALDTASAQTVIDFDFIKFDSWDENNGSGVNERLFVYIDGAVAFEFTPNGIDSGFGDGANANGIFAGGQWTVTSSGADEELGGSGSYLDRVYNVRIVLDASSDDTVTLGLGTTLNQDVNDESWGIDNVRIASVTDTSDTGQNTIAGGAGNDLIYGGDGDDSLSGEQGDDTINAGAGNDLITAGTGNDLVFAGDGSDTIGVGEGDGNGTIFGGEDASRADNDLLDLYETGSGQGVTVTFSGDEAGDFTFAGTGATGSFAGIESFVLTAQDDLIDASAATLAATIAAGSGDDTLIGGAGADRLLGGDDADTFFGGTGDTVVGGEGGTDSDTLFLNFSEIDSITYGGGNNEAGTVAYTDGGTLSFSEIEQIRFADVVDGTTGSDAMQPGYTDAQGDQIDGADGLNDAIFGGAGSDTINGGEGDDLIRGDAIDFDPLAHASSGGGAATSFTVQNDSDTHIHLYWVDTQGSLVSYGVIVPGASLTQPSFENHNWVLYDLSTGQPLQYLGVPVNGSTVTYVQGDDLLYGGDGDDRIEGDHGEDFLDGGSGTDSLFGGSGADRLEGGVGDDTLAGGSGNDTLVGGQGADSIDGGNFYDIVDYSASASAVQVDLSDGLAESGGDAQGDVLTNIDQVSGSQFADSFVAAATGSDFAGNGGNDSFLGGAGNDRFWGGDADDVMDGGAGNDLLEGQTGSDTFLFRDGFGNDTVMGEQDYDTVDLSALSNPVEVVFSAPGAGTITDMVTGETIIFSGIEQLILTQNGDTVDATLDDGYTYVQTRGGDDFIIGSSGNDIYDDEISTSNGQGNDTFIGGAGNDVLWLGTDQDVAFGGAGNDSLEGQEGDDTLHGDSGDDRLFGGSGDDLLVGGTGNDSLSGGDDSDRIRLEDGFGTDTIAGGEGGRDADVLLGSDLTTGATVVFTGDEAGTFSSGGNTASFSEIEGIALGDQADLLDASASTAPVVASGGGANDTMTGGLGGDVLVGDGQYTNLIQNGSFENTSGMTVTSWGYRGDDATAPGGWYTGSGGVIDVHNTGAGAASDGSNWLDMEGVAAVDTVSQAVQGVIHGQPYTLRFDAIDAVGDNAVNVFWNGQLIDTVAPGSAGHETYSYQVFGGSGDGSNILTFQSLGPIDMTGVAIDNVQLLGISNLNAAAGNDSLDGGAGDDTLLGGDGDDNLIGRSGADLLDGGAGNDTIQAGSEADTLVGASGDDLLYGEDGDDLIQGGDGVDTLHGGSGADALFGDAGNDLVLGEDGADRLEGGTGADTLRGDRGDDMLFGGDDADTALFIGNVTEYRFDYGPAGELIVTDLVADRDGQDTLSGFEYATFNGVTYHLVTGDDGSNTTLQGPDDGTPSLIIAHDGNDWGGGHPTSDAIFGGTGDDTLDGGDGDDTLVGEDGNDLLRGDAGNDSLIGGAGADTLSGGAGNDQIAPGQDGTSDIIVFRDGDGSDTITGLEGPVDNGDGTFTGIDRLDVSSLNDANGARVSTDDVTVTDDGSGNAVLSFPNGESLTLTGISPATADNPAWLAALGIPQPDYVISGTTGNDLIDAGYTGDPQGDMVDAGDATDGSNDDSISAGAGDDTVFAGEGADTVTGEDGNDQIQSNAGNDSVFGAQGADTIFGQDGDDTLFGGSENDVLDGDDANAGNDEISGGDGNDEIIGDGGNDTLFGGIGNDTIYAGADDDTVSGELDDDLIFAGSGNDTVSGDDGNDIIHGDTGNDSIEGGLGNDWLSGGADNDTVSGGDGADSVFGAEGDDRLSGGTGTDSMEGWFGNDVMDGGDGDDYLDGGVGDDTLIGGAGNDMLAAGSDEGADSVEGGDGDDNISAAGGNDTLFGGAGSDTVSAGDGADLIDGGDGADRLDAGDGNDTMRVGEGDTAFGGGGDDSFFVTPDMLNGGTLFIDGNEENETLGDRLNITGPARIVYDGSNPENGTVTWLDGSTLTFQNIETITYVPCFTEHTLIKTRRGEVPAARLRIGDMVLTRNHGYQPIRWIGTRRLERAQLAANPALNPVVIRAGALSVNTPERDLTVSPQHRMLIGGGRAQLWFGEDEVFVAALHLTCLDGVEQIRPEAVTYVHIMFDTHQIISGDGAWSESYQPGDMTMGNMDEEQRAELFAIFPELFDGNAGQLYPAARVTLKKHEVPLLFA